MEIECTFDILKDKEGHPLTVEEIIALDRLSKGFESRDGQKTMALVKNDDAFKIVRSEKPRNLLSLDRAPQPSFFIDDHLDDYIEYLDYLYLSGVKEASEFGIYLDEFEVLVKTLVCCYNVDINSNSSKIIKVTNKDNGNMLFFKSDFLRPTFNMSFLLRVRDDILARFKEARNKPNIKGMAKLLKNNPRPTLRVSTDE